MAIDETARLLNEIGELLAEDTDYPLDGTLLYAELDHGFVAPSIYKDRGDHILYRPPDLDQLGTTLYALWKSADPDKRWTEIEYIVRAGKFRAIFNYANEIASDDDPSNRREQIATKHFARSQSFIIPCRTAPRKWMTNGN